MAILLIALGGTLHAMDLVRIETRTDLTIQKYGVSGKGVTVAVIDRGIDWQNADFIKPDGTTRIRAMLDMSGQSGCTTSNPQPVEYSSAQINAALRGGPTIPERDAIAHGTATAGVAAGNGRAGRTDRFRGMAPEADLLIVKFTSDGAPAHDGQPAEAAFVACLIDALTWVDRKITEIGQPAVAIINSGTQWGPIDGTSVNSRKMDEVFGLARPGRVIVEASGDEGTLANHAAGTFTGASDATVRFTRPTTDETYMQMWYSGSAPAQITLRFDDGTVVGPVAPGSSVTRTDIAIYNYEPNRAPGLWDSNNGDRAVWFHVTGHRGGGTVGIRATRSDQGRFDLYGDLKQTVTFSEKLVGGRLTDYASTRGAVAVAAYTVRDTYTDIDGIRRSAASEGATGHLWTFSSGDPTRDGRFNLDVTAPGQNVFATLAKRSYWGTFRYNQPDVGEGAYFRFGATSGAAPIVVGAVALMLQMRPVLTGLEVRQILRATAVTDTFTGRTPNADWGHGKLDVLGALDAVSRCGQTCLTP